MSALSKEKGALDLAGAACAFDGQPAGNDLLAKAIELGCPVDTCAAIACALDAPAILAQALALGANPQAAVEYGDAGARDLRDPSPGDGSEVPSLLRRALVAQSPACVEILAPLLPDPLTRRGGAGPRSLGALCPYWKGGLLGAPGWEALRLALGRSQPNPEKATLLAQELADLAFFDHASFEAAGKALALFERLGELGADLAPSSQPPDKRPLHVIFGRLINSGEPKSVERLIDCSLAWAPHGVTDLLEQALIQWGRQNPNFGGPSPMMNALASQCLRLGEACPPESPAAQAVLAWVCKNRLETMDALSRGLKGAWSVAQGRQAQADLSWLLDAMPQWSAPSESVLPACARLIYLAHQLGAAQLANSDIGPDGQPMEPSQTHSAVASFPVRVAKAVAKTWPQLAGPESIAESVVSGQLRDGRLFDPQAQKAGLEAASLACAALAPSFFAKPPRL